MLTSHLCNRLLRGLQTCSRYPSNNTCNHGNNSCNHSTRTCYHGNNNSNHGNRHFHTTSVRSDYYKLLGVEPSATEKELKKAYFALAKECHPDISKGDESKKKFQDISAAYAVLSNAKLRKEYDTDYEVAPAYEFKSDVFKEQSPENIFRAAFGANFDDLLNSRFGYTTEMENHRQYRMGISMKEAALGADKYIEINAAFTCNNCQGATSTSREDKKGKLECQRCLGGGLIYNPQPKVPLFGDKQPPEWTMCLDCAGKGYRSPQYCTVCHGTGRRTEVNWHPVTVPSGIQDGQLLEVPGCEPGSTFTLTMVILPDYLHNFTYDTEGHIRSEIEIFYSTAVLGDTVFVNTLYGEDQLVIPPGTSDGTVLELETLDPKHTFTVRIHIARSDKQTSWGYNLYRELQQEQQRVESVCRVVGYSTHSKGAMRRRELYRVTLLPQYLWIVSLLDKAYHRLNKIPWCKKTFQMFDSQDSYQSKGEPMAMSQI